MVAHLDGMRPHKKGRDHGPLPCNLNTHAISRLLPVTGDVHGPAHGVHPVSTVEQFAGDQFPLAISSADLFSPHDLTPLSSGLLAGRIPFRRSPEQDPLFHVVQAAGRFARQRDRPFVHEVRVEARFNLPCCFRIGEHRRATSLSFDAAYAPGASAAIGATLNNTSDIETRGCQTAGRPRIRGGLMRLAAPNGVLCFKCHVLSEEKKKPRRGRRGLFMPFLRLGTNRTS